MGTAVIVSVGVGVSVEVGRGVSVGVGSMVGVGEAVEVAVGRGVSVGGVVAVGSAGALVEVGSSATAVGSGVAVEQAVNAAIKKIPAVSRKEERIRLVIHASLVGYFAQTGIVLPFSQEYRSSSNPPLTNMSVTDIMSV